MCVYVVYVVRDKLNTLHPYRSRAIGNYVHPEIFMRPSGEFRAHVRLNSSGDRMVAHLHGRGLA